MRDPNNIRNRWRRYKAACRAYNFRTLPFRDWAKMWGNNPKAYSAEPHHADYHVNMR
jgi:hypothetical protein